MYEEKLYINVPGVILEPKEKGGEVTLIIDTLEDKSMKVSFKDT